MNGSTKFRFVFILLALFHGLGFWGKVVWAGENDTISGSSLSMSYAATFSTDADSSLSPMSPGTMGFSGLIDDVIILLPPDSDPPEAKVIIHNGMANDPSYHPDVAITSASDRPPGSGLPIFGRLCRHDYGRKGDDIRMAGYGSHIEYLCQHDHD